VQRSIEYTYISDTTFWFASWMARPLDLVVESWFFTIKS